MARPTPEFLKLEPKTRPRHARLQDSEILRETTSEARQKSSFNCQSEKNACLEHLWRVFRLHSLFWNLENEEIDENLVENSEKSIENRIFKLKLMSETRLRHPRRSKNSCLGRLGRIFHSKTDFLDIWGALGAFLHSKIKLLWSGAPVTLFRNFVPENWGTFGAFCAQGTPAH